MFLIGGGIALIIAIVLFFVLMKIKKSARFRENRLLNGSTTGVGSDRVTVASDGLNSGTSRKLQFSRLFDSIGPYGSYTTPGNQLLKMAPPPPLRDDTTHNTARLYTSYSSQRAYSQTPIYSGQLVDASVTDASNPDKTSTGKGASTNINTDSFQSSLDISLGRPMQQVSYTMSSPTNQASTMTVPVSTSPTTSVTTVTTR